MNDYERRKIDEEVTKLELENKLLKKDLKLHWAKKWQAIGFFITAMLSIIPASYLLLSGYFSVLAEKNELKAMKTENILKTKDIEIQNKSLLITRQDSILNEQRYLLKKDSADLLSLKNERNKLTEIINQLKSEINGKNIALGLVSDSLIKAIHTRDSLKFEIGHNLTSISFINS